MATSSPAPRNTDVPPPPARPVIVGAKPSPDELRARIDRAESAFKGHLAGLRSEITLADVNVDGMPLFDRVRARPLLTVGVTVAAAAAVPLLIGLARRSRPEPDRQAQWWEAYINDFMDDAAFRVQRGVDSGSALHQALRRRAPVIYVEQAPPKRPSAVKASATSGLSTIVNTALGFALKFALDRLTQELTGRAELFQAVDDATEG